MGFSVVTESRPVLCAERLEAIRVITGILSALTVVTNGVTMETAVLFSVAGRTAQNAELWLIKINEQARIDAEH
jgi:hypothetical protein